MVLVVVVLVVAVFVGVGEPGTSPSLDLTFIPTGLSENLGGMERGRGGKGGETTCLTFTLPPLASASNTTLGVGSGGVGSGGGANLSVSVSSVGWCVRVLCAGW